VREIKRHGEQEVAEGAGPEAQLAQNQRGPAIREDFGRLRDRAKLSVA
jgi:hypothetical protein